MVLSDRMTELSYVGPSTLRFEAPDVIYIATVGDISGDDMTRIFADIARLTVGQDHYFLLNNISQLGKISPEARKRATDEIDTLRMRGGAVFGAAFPQRVVATLLARLLSLFGNFGARPIVIVETEAQARAWLETRRRELTSG